LKLPPDSRLRADVGSLLEAVGETSRPEVLDSLLIHLRLLARWNDAYGLTRITDWPQVLDRHVRESLLPLRWIPDAPGRLLDVGSGNGFPALPILACRPQLTGVLLERSERKGLFLDAAVRELGWTGRVVIDATDAEAFAPSSPGGIERDSIRPGTQSAADMKKGPEVPRAISEADSSIAQRTTEDDWRERAANVRDGEQATKAIHKKSAADIIESSGGLGFARPDCGRPFDYIVSRATLAPERFLDLASRWIRPGGRVLVFAGEFPDGRSRPSRGARHKASTTGSGTGVEERKESDAGRRPEGAASSPLRLVRREPLRGRRASYLYIFEFAD
jgi:16S rRNA G527 N7-methylase RsmG